jgi:hypothetical protein
MTEKIKVVCLLSAGIATIVLVHNFYGDNMLGVLGSYASIISIPSLTAKWEKSNGKSF